MDTQFKDVQLKVDINPSYEWDERAKDMTVSHRELEVLALVVEGYKNKEIARILKIQHQSVKNHLQHLFKKLDVKNSTQAYIIALHLNMIKMRAKNKDITTELTGEGFIKYFRDIISGNAWYKGLTENDKKKTKLFLKEHGIEPADWKEE